MKRIIDFLYDWGQLIIVIIFVVGCIGFIVYEATRPRLVEGLVTNKMSFPGYSTCDDNKCKWHSEQWIVTVQNGDEFDSWFVSERYYDSVQIGDWVKK